MNGQSRGNISRIWKLLWPENGIKSALSILAISGIAYGFGHRWFKNPERIHQMVSWKVDDLLDEIKATPAQRSQINAVKDRMLRQGAEIMKEHHAIHEELLTQWNSNNPDVAKIHSLIDERAEKFKAFAHRAVDEMAKVHQVLTPEQRAKLAQEHEKCAQRHHRMPGGPRF